jgi:hypothetical protein
MMIRNLIDAETKLVPTFRVAKRPGCETTTAFMLDVADRMKNGAQVSTGVIVQEFKDRAKSNEA